MTERVSLKMSNHNDVALDVTEFFASARRGPSRCRRRRVTASRADAAAPALERTAPLGRRVTR